MKYNHIEYKKPFYKIKAPLRNHLIKYSRLVELPISYNDLLRYESLVPLQDKNGEATLWYSAMYKESEVNYLQDELVLIYQMLVAGGVKIAHLRIESIDFCSFGNSKPFRIKVVNKINGNHDYFYVKKADASRIYGLELEQIFSPDKIVFLYHKDTLIEEHIVGVPADEFLLKNKKFKIANRTRLAKEFVKFNERCFVRLLGDMRAYNFVLTIIQDFDNVQYRIRPMDFDQQSYEGRKNLYLPQYYKDNIGLVNLARELITHETAEQYTNEERMAMALRYVTDRHRTRSLLKAMRKDQISTKEHIDSLAKDLAEYHNDPRFLSYTTMGEILTHQIELKLGIVIF